MKRYFYDDVFSKYVEIDYYEKGVFFSYKPRETPYMRYEFFISDEEIEKGYHTIEFKFLIEEGDIAEDEFDAIMNSGTPAERVVGKR